MKNFNKELNKWLTLEQMIQTKFKTRKNIFKPRSDKKWVPKNTHYIIEAFIKDTSKDIEIEKSKQKKTNNLTIQTQHNNLTIEERRTLNERKVRSDVIISNVDKGGAVVTRDIKKYIQEAERQGNNKHYYRDVNHNPTTAH